MPYIRDLEKRDGVRGKRKNPDIVLISVLNFRWEKLCSFRENWSFWKFRHDTRKIYNNLFIMFNLTLTRKPSLWGGQLYFHPDDVGIRPWLPAMLMQLKLNGLKLHLILWSSKRLFSLQLFPRKYRGFGSLESKSAALQLKLQRFGSWVSDIGHNSKLWLTYSLFL